MAAEISQVAGMAFMGATPWHGLGTRLDENATMADWYVKAGLDYEVVKKKLSIVEEDSIKGVDFYATCRSDTGGVLGYVGPIYKVLQNKDAFNFFEPFVVSGSVKLHTAGTLREGARIWVLAKIAGDPLEIVKGDDVEQFLMLSNGHDGTLSVRVGYTPIRIVCANTLRMAHRSSKSKLIRMRHSAQIVKNLEEVRDVMNIAKQEFEGTAEQYRRLASRQVNTKDLEKYFRTVLDVKELDKARKDLPTRTQNRIEELFKLFEIGKGTEIKGVKGTAWGAYNAVTEQLSWTASRNQANRFDSLWFGPNEEVNRVALEEALTLAA